MNTNPIFDEQLRAVFEEVPLDETHLEWDADAVWAKIALPEKKYRLVHGLILALAGIVLLCGIGWGLTQLLIANLMKPLDPVIQEPPMAPMPEHPHAFVPSERIMIPKANRKALTTQHEAVAIATSAQSAQDEAVLEFMSHLDNHGVVTVIPTLDMLNRTLMSQEPIRPLPAKSGVNIVMRLPVLEEKPQTSFVVRLVREIARFNTQGKVNWYNLNIEPQEGMSFRIITYKNAETSTEVKDN